MGTRLYIGNLSYGTTEASLRAAFAEDGRSVRQVTLVTDRVTGQPRGFAFVEMENEGDAAQAIKILDGRDLDGRNMRVSEARPREAGAGGAGGNRGGYSGAGASGGGTFERSPGGSAPVAPARNFGADAKPGGGRGGFPPKGRERDRDGDGGGGGRGGKRRRDKDDWGE